MSAPDHSLIVKAVYDDGGYNLTNHDDQADFVDDVVFALHAKDPRWGHLKKSGAQTQIHGHAEDAALYLSDTPGQSQAVDFIAGAGGPNPQPGWSPDTPRYSRSDWYAPADHPPVGAPEPPQPPQPPTPCPETFGYPDENTAGKAFQARVKQAYTDAHRPFPDPNDQDAFRHFMRYGYSSRSMPEPQAADKHIAELRAQLGLP